MAIAKAGIISSIKDAISQFSGNQDGGILGPPAPDQTWNEYEDAVRNSTFVANTQKSKTQKAIEDKKNKKEYYGNLLSKANDQTSGFFDGIKNFMGDPGPTENQINTGRIDPEYKAENSQWNNIDVVNHLNQDVVDNNPTYESYFNEQQAKATAGLDPTQMAEYENENRSFGDAIGESWNYALNGDDTVGKTLDAFEQAQKHGVDRKGAYDRDSLTSDKMMGDKYIEYANLGMGGLPVDQINPNKVYSKIDEARNNGFIPYIPDEDASAKMYTQQLFEMPNEVFNDLANARETGTDYTVDIDGTKISGNEFDGKSRDYLENMSRIISDGSSSVYDRNADHSNDSAYRAASWIVNVDGKEVELPGGRYEAQYASPGSSAIIVTFQDGSMYEFDDIEDMNQNLRAGGVEKTEDFDEAISFVPDLVMDDGTRVSYDDVSAIATGTDVEGINYVFGPLNLYKPQRLQDDFWTENGFNFEDFAPKLVDIALGSAPYFYLPTSIPLGLSRAYTASQGVDPSTINTDSGARLTSDNIDADQYVSSIVGNALMPLTELGLGRIGGRLIKKPLEGVKNRIGERAWMPGLEWFIGSGGEGLEEIPGNIVENFSQNGVKNFYSNPMLDENGNTIIDDSGHAVYDPNTSLTDRGLNFIADIPEAFTGGFALGSAFGIPELLTTTRTDTRDIYQKNKRDKAAGLNVYRKGKRVDGVDVPLDDNYKEFLSLLR